MVCGIRKTILCRFSKLLAYVCVWGDPCGYLDFSLLSVRPSTSASWHLALSISRRQSLTKPFVEVIIASYRIDSLLSDSLVLFVLYSFSILSGLTCFVLLVSSLLSCLACLCFRVNPSRHLYILLPLLIGLFVSVSLARVSFHRSLMSRLMSPSIC